MAKSSASGIALGDSTGTDVTVDISVEGPDESEVEQLLIDLRARAYRDAQALADGVHPTDAEPHLVEIDWDDVINGGDA